MNQALWQQLLDLEKQNQLWNLVGRVSDLIELLLLVGIFVLLMKGLEVVRDIQRRMPD